LVVVTHGWQGESTDGPWYVTVGIAQIAKLYEAKHGLKFGLCHSPIPAWAKTQDTEIGRTASVSIVQADEKSMY